MTTHVNVALLQDPRHLQGEQPYTYYGPIIGNITHQDDIEREREREREREGNSVHEDLIIKWGPPDAFAQRKALSSTQKRSFRSFPFISISSDN